MRAPGLTCAECGFTRAPTVASCPRCSGGAPSEPATRELSDAGSPDGVPTRMLHAGIGVAWMGLAIAWIARGLAGAGGDEYASGGAIAWALGFGCSLPLSAAGYLALSVLRTRVRISSELATRHAVVLFVSSGLLPALTALIASITDVANRPTDTLYELAVCMPRGPLPAPTFDPTAGLHAIDATCTLADGTPFEATLMAHPILLGGSLRVAARRGRHFGVLIEPGAQAR